MFKGHCFLTLFLLLLVLSEHWSCPSSPYIHITVLHIRLILWPWRWKLCIEMLLMMYQATWHHITVFLLIFILFIQLVSVLPRISVESVVVLVTSRFWQCGIARSTRRVHSIYIVTECLKQCWSQSLPLFCDVSYQQIMDTSCGVHFSTESTDWPERWFICCGLLFKKCTK
jgi:hypothetical protein